MDGAKETESITGEVWYVWDPTLEPQISFTRLVTFGATNTTPSFFIQSLRIPL